jgi:oxygen-independent coproporphyrinogen-3 oxidase
MHAPVGLYLSVPFCKAKCSFCNFASDAFAPGRMDVYVDELCGEIREAQTRAANIGARLEPAADSVYFGGGTPSLLSAAQFGRIFKGLRGEFELAADAEMTLECAPGQLAEETLAELLRQGVNRVSLGVQSFVDREAQAVGRLHTGAECEAEIARLRTAGVKDIGLDLIAGLPHQTEASWRESVNRAIQSGVTHVSVYMLEVDEDSRLGREVLAGGGRYGAAQVPSEDDAAALYEWGCELLDVGGVRQYEISNFARDGHRSRHNMKYWQRKPYIGFGLDAHSMLPTERGAVRFQNPDDLDVYLDTAKGPFEILREESGRAEFVSGEAAFEESLFLGLRMNEGVRIDALQKEFGSALVEAVMPSLVEAQDAGLVAVEEQAVRLTARGRMASNEVLSRVLAPAAI